MRLKRLGVITVVMVIVLSLAGLASADEVAVPTEATGMTIEPGSEVFPLYEDPSVEPLPVPPLLEFVLYWGFPELVGDTTDPADHPCLGLVEGEPCLNVEGPNGQVNHGQFMKAFVHWLKSDEGVQALFDAGYEGKKGHLVRQAAHNAFGKGAWKKTHGIAGLVPLDSEKLEADDSDGGPNHVYGHAKNKNK